MVPLAKYWGPGPQAPKIDAPALSDSVIEIHVSKGRRNSLFVVFCLLLSNG